MKRMTYFVMTLALVLGFTQCKKEQIEPQNGGNSVMITLNVDGGDNNGSKAEVNPPHVNFVDGDRILVACAGHYVGTLINNDGTNFSGEVSDQYLVTGESLYFYFLGNQEGALEDGATNCTVNISDQRAYPTLPVISMGVSSAPYSSNNHTYSSRLYNKCSLMKFNVTTPSTAAICITGMKNEVTVHFDNPTDSGFDYNMNTTDGGLIKMKGQEGNGTKTYWAIVLPQVALTETGEAYSEDQNYIGTRPTIHAIEANKYYHEGDDVINMEVNTLNPDGPLATPLTLEALSDGTIKVNSPKSGMQFSLNGGTKTTMTGTTTINVNMGNKVQFYCTGTYSGNYYQTTIKDGTAQVKVYGNIMSLVNETNYASVTTLAGSAFYGLFNGNANLIDASGLLLPATTLASGCYAFMFKFCTSLTAAPTLPAETLASLCYRDMFYGCTSLTTAPTLPATTLAANCYLQMFYDCSSLSSITCLATSGINSSSSTSGWMTNAGRDVTGTKTFIRASGASVSLDSSGSGSTWPRSANGIPTGWTVEEYSVE